MKVRLIIFLALLFSRVFVTPVCFSLHAGEVQNPADTFEQVRLKKRRSSFIEEEYFHEASYGIVTSVVVVKRIKLCESFPRWVVQQYSSIVVTLHRIIEPAAKVLFLRNRVLRI